MNLLHKIHAQHPQIAVMLAATLMVIYGNDLNRFFRRKIRKWPFYLRLLFFVALCAIGYGMFTLWLSRILSRFFGALSLWEFLGVTTLAFVLLGLMAEHKKQM